MTVWLLQIARRRAERRGAAEQLPIAADLLAAALRAGASPGFAALVVGEAIGGPIGARLVRVSRALRLGIAPAEAWEHLGDVPGARWIVRAAVRSSENGLMLAGALHRAGMEVRAGRAVAAETAARRAGVLAVMPLGLCFLPAFLLTSVAPVVIEMVNDMAGQASPVP